MPITEPIFFATPADFRNWLEENHDRVDELWVGYYKKASKIPGITWPESVDQALCFGWIDGLRKSIDEKSYMIRFTPRRPGSIWSSVNLRRMAELLEAGQVHTAGRAAFARRKEEKSGVYSYEEKPVQLTEEYERIFRNNAKAWAYFQTLSPSSRQTSISWVLSAKREETRQTRLKVLIQSSEEQQKIPLLRR